MRGLARARAISYNAGMLAANARLTIARPGARAVEGAFIARVMVDVGASFRAVTKILAINAFFAAAAVAALMLAVAIVGEAASHSQLLRVITAVPAVLAAIFFSDKKAVSEKLARRRAARAASISLACETERARTAYDEAVVLRVASAVTGGIMPRPAAAEALSRAAPQALHQDPRAALAASHLRAVMRALITLARDLSTRARTSLRIRAG